jgi:transposase
MASESREQRQRYGAELKAQIMAECEAPGASVARVAMAHGINANVVHRWRQLAREGGARRTRSSTTPVTATATSFVPVVVSEASKPAQFSDIRIELRRGATAMTITWPTQAAADCAIWLRELLQ